MNSIGGMERILTSKMNYLAENTPIQISFLTYESQSSILPFKLSQKIKYYPINAPIARRINYSFIKWIKAYFLSRINFRKRMSEMLCFIKPDIVILNAYSFDELDIIIDICKKKYIHSILESHVEASTVLMSEKYRYNLFLYFLVKKWDRFILRTLHHVDRIVTLTKGDIPFWEKWNNNIIVIPNMLTIHPQDFANYSSKRVISVGRYTYQKGFDMLIEAWELVHKRNPDWELYIWGSGDMTIYYEFVQKYALENVIHLMPASLNIAEEYSKSSIYVMSSRHEGFGLVLTEAMCCGLPCISFDCPFGPSEIINDGVDGLLVERNNIKQLADKIILLINNYELRKKMGLAAMRNVKRFSVDIIMKRWIDLFNELINVD